MSPELEEILCARYPEILPSFGKPGTLQFGLECGDGWFELIDATCRLIQRHPVADTETVVATQIKEKFGTLRFYHRGGDDFVYSLINLVEELSGSICEICGGIGSTSERNNWLRTRCPLHTAGWSRTTSIHFTSVDSPSRLSDILAAVLGLFKHDSIAAAKWLNAPNWALPQSPLAEAISNGNYSQVVTLIGQIEYGVL